MLGGDVCGCLLVLFWGGVRACEEWIVVYSAEHFEDKENLI